MTLKAIRTKFVQLSGRYDLVVDAVDYVDAGANFYINAGIKMLDRMLDVQATRAKLFYGISANEYSLSFQHNCRYITECWINSATARYPLERIELGELKEYYNEPAGSTTTGRPKYYALSELRALETTDQTSLATFIDDNHAETDAKYDYRGIVFVPPADGDYVIEINGYFKSVALSSDNDENFWTLQEDDLVLRAALYKHEIFTRGTENAKNWLSAIKDDILEIDKDIAAEESFGLDQLEG